MVAEGHMAGRHTWIDALRLFAGISMVGLHVTADSNGQPFPEVSPQERLVPMLLRTVLYTARTELFLMISVLLLLMALSRRPRGYNAVVREQARRLLVPFAFWTVFYAGYGLIKAHAFGYGDAEWARVISWQGWAGFLLLGDVKYHMHFIPTLFGLLLFYPLFRCAEKAPLLGLLVVVFLGMKSALEAVVYPALWGSEWLPYVVRLVKVLTYTGYGFAAAAVLGLWQGSTVAERVSWLGPIALIGAGLFVFKSWAMVTVVRTGHWVFDDPSAYWADYLMPVGLLFICMCLGHKSWPLWMSHVSKYAFGLYLCHPIFLDIAEIALRDSAWSPTRLICAEFLWTAPMTALLVWMLGRWRGGAWTVGLGPLPPVALGRGRQEV
ncbi:acyltransferase [Shimia sp.]|uniref:acyltransferase n=1 Tax=Shimia sp. TaxID=1954381 RepID=UPI003B8B9341